MALVASKHIILHEFEEFEPPKEELSELSSRGLISRSNGKYSFHQAGSYVTRNQIYIILPWFLADSSTPDDSLLTQSDDPTINILNIFHWIKMGSATVSATAKDIISGREFVLYTLLKQVEKMVKEGIKHNVFRTEIGKRPSIKGRWLISKDISKEETPIQFTCLATECDKNHPLLMLARRYSSELATKGRSRVVRRAAERLSSFLGQYADWPNDLLRTMRSAEYMASIDKRFRNWRCWISVLKWSNESDLSRTLVDSGTSADLLFPTPRFFEHIVERTLTDLGLKCEAQRSGRILGGAKWVNNKREIELLEEEAEDLAANQSSRPDLFVYQGSNVPLLVECKYKRLEATVHSGVSQIRGFSRNDRNQLLSFVLSSSDKLRFNTSKIIVLYPLLNSSMEDVVPELKYSAKFARRDVAQLEWAQSLADSNVKIYFFGIDLKKLIREISIEATSKKSELQRILNFFNSCYERDVAA